MQTVRGIAGVFLRAEDPDALARWYDRHLGIPNIADRPWMQEAGPTVFAPFAKDSDYFPTDRSWMLNLRVGDLDAMCDQLRAAGIDVETRVEWDSEIGRFARIHDPEGNPIEFSHPLHRGH